MLTACINAYDSSPAVIIGFYIIMMIMTEAPFTTQYIQSHRSIVGVKNRFTELRQN